MDTASGMEILSGNKNMQIKFKTEWRKGDTKTQLKSRP